MSDSQIRTDIRGLIDIALPISIGTFVQFLVLLTDNYFLARVGENSINGAGNAGLTYLTFGMLIYGSATGIQILVARRKGEGNDQLQIRTGRLGLQINTLIGVGLCITLLILNNGFLGSLIHSGEVRDVFEPYLDTRLWGSIPYGITLAMTAYWTGIARTKLLIVVSLNTALSNLFLDYALILGNLGFEAMGHIGAARASLIAETFGFLVSLALMLQVEPRFFKLPKTLDGVILKEWWKISAPLMGQLLLTVGVWTSFFFFVEKVGSTELKVSHIGRNAFMFAFIVTSGIGQTTRTVVSTLIGAKRSEELVSTVKKLWVINMIGVLILTHGFILYPEIISRIFFDKPEHIEMMSSTFFSLFIAVLGYGSSHILLTTLEGSGGTKRAFAVEMLGGAMYLAVLLYLTTPVDGSYRDIEVIWRVEWVYFTFIILGSYFAIRNGKWKKGLESLS